MKNNQAMLFLNHVAFRTAHSEDYCNETSMDTRDGFLYDITGTGAVRVFTTDEFSIWQFPDLSIILAHGEPDDIERSQGCQLEYLGKLADGNLYREGAVFESGRVKYSGFFKDGMYVPPDVSEAPKSDSVFSFKEVIDSIIHPKIPSYSSEELATDHEKAQHYLLSRSKDVQVFAQAKVLVWEKIDIASKKAKLYESGYVHQHVGWSNWGKFVSNTRGVADVRFKTYECFVAWVLKKFW